MTLISSMQSPEVNYISYCGSGARGILMVKERAHYLRPWRELHCSSFLEYDLMLINFYH